MKVRSWHRMEAVIAGLLFVAAVVMSAFFGMRDWDLTGRIVITVIELLFGLKALYHFRKYRQIPPDDTTEMGHEAATRFVGPNSRKFAWIALALGLVMAGAEVWELQRHGTFHFAVLILAPMVLLLAIGGLFDSRILVACGRICPRSRPKSGVSPTRSRSQASPSPRSSSTGSDFGGPSQ